MSAAPFIECEDGKHVMDSLTIALYVHDTVSTYFPLPVDPRSNFTAPRSWLDKTYPDRYNLFLPEAELPVDVEGQDYKQAVQRFESEHNVFADWFWSRGSA